MKDLLRTADLSRADIELLLDTAAEFAENPLRSKDALAHKSVAIYMTKPSTRTRLSSETAVAHLGGTPIFIRGDELQLGRGETIADTARIISGYCDALIIRTFAQADVDELGAKSTIPIINALTDDDHPTQLLADWLTIRENYSDFANHGTAARHCEPGCIGVGARRRCPDTLVRHSCIAAAERSRNAESRQLIINSTPSVDEKKLASHVAGS